MGVSLILLVNWWNFHFFSVQYNRFSGTISCLMYNSSSLLTFAISENQIQGSLPFNIGITLPNIKVFIFGDNQFTGSIPVSISNATNLDTFEMGINKLSGNQAWQIDRSSSVLPIKHCCDFLCFLLLLLLHYFFLY